MTDRFPVRARRIAAAVTLILAALPAAATTPAEDAPPEPAAHRQHRVRQVGDMPSGTSFAPILDLAPTVPGASFQLSLGGLDPRGLVAGGMSMRMFVAQPSWVSFGLVPSTAAAPVFNGWWNGLSGGTDVALERGAREGDTGRSMSRFATLQVAITPVPEPSDWLAMGAGLTLLTMLMRRRARRQARAIAG